MSVEEEPKTKVRWVVVVEGRGILRCVLFCFDNVGWFSCLARFRT
jgi:hypothetical protein